MTEKVTTMVLKVDLQCPRCYKKAKKVLCKFPQIRDRIFDEKGNKVIITVVCCSPEKIRDKLCYKGGGVIKSIEIQEKPKAAGGEKTEEAGKAKPAAAPDKSKEQEKPKAAAAAPEKTKEPEKPKAAAAAPEKPKAAAPEKPKAAAPEKPKVVVPEKPKAAEVPEKPKMPEKQNGKGDIPAAEKPKAIPITGNPPLVPGKMEAVTAQGVPQFYPGMPYYDSGYRGGPYYNGYGVPPPPQPFFEGYYHGPQLNHHGYPIQQYEHYFTEENPSACSIM